MIRKKLILSMGTVMIVGGLAGCGAQEEAQPHHPADHANEQQMMGDARETTAGVKTLPSFVNGLDPKVAQIYQIAALNADVLKWIPCYCGCGESAGHESNLDCFIHEIKQDGQIVWDSHGTKCGTCMDIAVESAKLKQEGKSVKEIRQYIDQKYRDGYAKPTPTPMPS
ncbi:PCYCGC motif-containing (lipo)protein [Laceyella putida]|uniref:PCYCGC motif-containing (Lipo)protein n=1 Tax=Laceyella putida TaxID=110101 RepID=A0ABW2RM12_9BACL